MDDVAIIGVGRTAFGRFPGTSAIELGATATRMALADAGITWKQVQFAFGGSYEVDNPDAVSVSTTEGRRGGLQLDVRVGDGDMGRVIGKRGRIAQSIRTVVRAAAVKDDVSVDIEFVD